LLRTLLECVRNDSYFCSKLLFSIKKRRCNTLLLRKVALKYRKLRSSAFSQEAKQKERKHPINDQIPELEERKGERNLFSPFSENWIKKILEFS
jgi:hypothetical protein